MSVLTSKQERFCQEMIKPKANQSKAYRAAFNTKRMKAETIHSEASKLMKNPQVTARILELRAPVVAQMQGKMADRLQELSYAAFLDPAACFDDFGHPLSLQVMPEHVRRAIASYEVDPTSCVTKIKFVDKLGAIMGYSKLVGDIPKENSTPSPVRTPQYDFSKLTDAEFKEYVRLKHKARIADAP